MNWLKRSREEQEAGQQKAEGRNRNRLRGLAALRAVRLRLTVTLLFVLRLCLVGYFEA